MQSILILFFFCRVEKLSIFTTPLVLTRARHYARALHITRYTYLCQHFIHVCRLDACQYTWRWDHNPSVKGAEFHAQYFQYSAIAGNLLLTSVICSAFVAVWDIFCFYTTRYRIRWSSRLLPSKASMYWSDEFLNRSLEVPRASIFKHCPEPRHSGRTFSQPHVVCMPPNSRSTYSTIFARLQCSHSRSCIRSEQHSCCLFQATAPTQ